MHSSNSTRGKVSAIHLCVGHRAPMHRVEEVIAKEDFGLVGDRHASRGSKRQLLLISGEVLEEVGLPEGAVRENITVRGMTLVRIVEGTRLRIGEATVEITGECEPCSRMDEVRTGLMDALRRRRGMLAYVIGTGRIKVGDRVDVLQHG